MVGGIISDWEHQGNCCHIPLTAINRNLTRGYLNCLQATVCKHKDKMLEADIELKIIINRSIAFQ